MFGLRKLFDLRLDDAFVIFSGERADVKECNTVIRKRTVCVGMWLA